MKINEIGERGVVFTFDDDISVYLIKGDYQYILCDTHLGPLSMKVIKEYLSDLPEKEIIIFNSHSDWDHIWGNCAFTDAKIIAHEKARSRMKEIGEYELNRLREFHNGDITLTLPNLIFSEKLSFADEGIEFIYAPGHTIDSSLCFDQKDSVLFVGDLVEFPLPYLDFYDLPHFIRTLEVIKSFPAKYKLSAHSGFISNELIERNITYIQGILQGETISPEMIGEASEVHQYNLNNHFLLQHEPEIRKRFGQDFDYASYKSNFIDLGKITTDELKIKLEKYIDEIKAPN